MLLSPVKCQLHRRARMQDLPLGQPQHGRAELIAEQVELLQHQSDASAADLQRCAVGPVSVMVLQ